MRACVCVCVSVRESERQKKSERVRKRQRKFARRGGVGGARKRHKAYFFSLAKDRAEAVEAFLT